MIVQLEQRILSGSHLLKLETPLQEVGKLLAKVESTRAELVPRKKFAFRSKRKQGTGAKARERPTVSSPASAPTRESDGMGEGLVKGR